MRIRVNCCSRRSVEFMQTIKASWSGIRIMTIKRIDRGSECARRYQRETGPFPSVFKEGWLRLDKKVPFLSGADGWLVNSNKN